jgi:hypothetical protein
MMAGATPSARAAALKLPRVATEAKVSKTLSLSKAGSSFSSFAFHLKAIARGLFSLFAST